MYKIFKHYPKRILYNLPCAKGNAEFKQSPSEHLMLKITLEYLNHTEVDNANERIML